MKVVVVYKSISGFTEKYANWISKELKSDILKQKDVKKHTLDNYDLIIYGGSLHAVGIIGFKKIKKLISNLDNKKLIVFSVGASPYKEKTIEEIRKHNLDENTKLFYLRGGFDFKKLNLVNKIIMFMFVKMLKNKKNKTKDDIGMISAYHKPADFTKKQNIDELVNYTKNILKK